MFLRIYRLIIYNRNQSNKVMNQIQLNNKYNMKLEILKIYNFLKIYKTHQTFKIKTNKIFKINKIN